LKGYGKRRGNWSILSFLPSRKKEKGGRQRRKGYGGRDLQQRQHEKGRKPESRVCQLDAQGVVTEKRERNDRTPSFSSDTKGTKEESARNGKVSRRAGGVPFRGKRGKGTER